MSTELTVSRIQWQDMKVKSEIDTTLEIAHQERWEDCEIFGYGKMFTEPQESMGWKLIPADLYEYSIPAEGVDRVRQIIQAGVRIQGVIIADDERSAGPPRTPAWPAVSLPSSEAVMSLVRKVLFGLICVAGAISAIWLISLIPLIIVGLFVGGAVMSAVAYDPKLVILVDDGNGGTVWVSVFTWYK